MRVLTGLCLFFLVQAVTVTHAADSAITSPSIADPTSNVVRLSEPVMTSDTREVFGAMLDDSGPTVTLQELVRDKDRYLDREVVVTTRIEKVCQKKGCFFVAQDGDAVARVTFKDYSFFIPTDSAGKRVTLAGTFSETEISEAKAKHYAADLQKTDQAADASVQGDTLKDMAKPPASDARSGSRVEYQIVATSVSIPK